MSIKNRLLMPFYKLYNKMIIKNMGGKVEPGLNIANKLYYKVPKGAKVQIGHNFTFTSGGCYNPLARNIRGCIFLQNREAELIIGDNVGISSSTLWVTQRVEIGSYTNIGADCMILDTDCHSLDWQYRGKRGGRDEQGRSLDRLHTKSAPVKIGEDVMIGARSIILKGVTIGDRAVIGAGSVVSKDIPADCIAAGNPCRVIKQKSLVL